MKTERIERLKAAHAGATDAYWSTSSTNAQTVRTLIEGGAIADGVAYMEASMDSEHALYVRMSALHLALMRLRGRAIEEDAALYRVTLDQIDAIEMEILAEGVGDVQ